MALFPRGSLRLDVSEALVGDLAVWMQVMEVGGARWRPTLELEDEDYTMPALNSLYDAGLKLFLGILNGPDGHNKEAEVKLRKFIDKRRTRMTEDGTVLMMTPASIMN